MSNVQLAITGGDFQWDGVNGAVATSSFNANMLVFQSTLPATDPNFRIIELDFTTSLTGTSGQTVNLNTVLSYVQRGDTSVNGAVSFTGGSLTATPVPFESDALPIVGAAAFMAGGLWWKRRRAHAKANLDFLGVTSGK